MGKLIATAWVRWHADGNMVLPRDGVGSGLANSCWISKPPTQFFPGLNPQLNPGVAVRDSFLQLRRTCCGGRLSAESSILWSGEKWHLTSDSWKHHQKWDVLIQFCSRQILVGFGGIVHCDPVKLMISPQAIYCKHQILVYCQFSSGNSRILKWRYCTI